MSKKVRTYVTGGGLLWVWNGRNEVVARHHDGGINPHTLDADPEVWTLEYSDGAMPSHYVESFSSEADLIKAMREIADLRKWKYNTD